MMGHQLNVMMQVSYPDDKADLPNGLYVMRTYTELKDGSWSVSCMVSLGLFAGPERILRRFSIFTEEPCKSIITTTEPCNPVFKEAQPRPSESV